MAHMSQEHKAKIVALAKPILDKYRMKATFSVNHHSTIVCTIKSGPLEFDPQYAGQSVNHYWINNHYSGDKAQFLTELVEAMNLNNYDNSQIEYDIHDVGHYLHVRLGSPGKPYKYTP